MRFKLFSKRRLISSALSLLVLTMALCLVQLGRWVGQEAPEQLTVRSVEVIIPTPPPPPPPSPAVEQAPANTHIAIQTQGAGPSLPMIKVKHKHLSVSKPETMSLSTEQPQWQSLEVRWNAFDLSDLDDLPKLLTPIRAVFPKTLARQGVSSVLIKLDVMIDEQGRVTLIEVAHNPHPELATAIRKIVRDSRFTAPTKDNQPVRARFIWPINIKS